MGEGMNWKDEGTKLSSRVLQEVKRDDVTRLAEDLIAIPTVNPPGGERPICEYMASWFEKRGVQASLLEEVEGRTNIQVELSGDREGGLTLILNGHTDVVPVGNGWSRDPFGAGVERGRVYGRGSGDMKGGLAAMMVAADAIRKNRKHLAGRLIFQAVADEEVGTPIGTDYLVRAGLRGDFAIVGEPTGLDVCVCHKGVIRFKITTFGRAAHGGVPERGINAILGMNRIIDALRDYAEVLGKGRGHPLLGPPTVNIGTIEGGVRVNVVPDRCTIAVERRVVPPETVEEAIRQVRSVVSGAARAYGMKHKLQFDSRSQPSEARDDRGSIDLLLRVVRGVTGKGDAGPKGFVATCDARYLNNIAGIPTVVFGPGSLENVHNADEWVSVKELQQASQVYALFYLGLQGQQR